MGKFPSKSLLVFFLMWGKKNKTFPYLFSSPFSISKNYPNQMGSKCMGVQGGEGWVKLQRPTKISNHYYKIKKEKKKDIPV